MYFKSNRNFEQRTNKIIIFTKTNYFIMKPVFLAFPVITLSLFLFSCGNTSEDQKNKISEDTDSW